MERMDLYRRVQKEMHEALQVGRKAFLEADGSVRKNSFLDAYLNYGQILDSGKARERLERMGSRLESEPYLPELRKLFCLYLNIKNAKKSGYLELDVRYRGQNVGLLRVLEKAEDGVYVKLSTKRDAMSNYCFFSGETNGQILKQPFEESLSHEKAQEFMAYFRQNPKPLHDPPKDAVLTRKKESNFSNEEHRVESLLLGEFELPESDAKQVRNIQPIKLMDKVRFAMTTGIADSKHKPYAAQGSAIDILARTWDGSHNYLTVIEVKNENKSGEEAEAALRQAAAYTAFLYLLLRSKDERADCWWRLYGMGERVPNPQKEKILFRIVSAMPEKGVTGREDLLTGLCGRGAVIPIEPMDDLDHPKGDCVELHTIFFEDRDTCLNHFSHTFTTSVKA